MELNIATQTRSRAQVLRDKVVIRLATNEAGPLISDVLEDNGITLPHADWSKVAPHWLIAATSPAPRLPTSGSRKMRQATSCCN